MGALGSVAGRLSLDSEGNASRMTLCVTRYISGMPLGQALVRQEPDEGLSTDLELGTAIGFRQSAISGGRGLGCLRHPSEDVRERDGGPIPAIDADVETGPRAWQASVGMAVEVKVAVP